MTNNNSIGLVKEMTDAKYTSVTAFTDFINYREYHFSCIFCFYEGEDGKYYNERIKKITENEIIEIIVGDKKNVIKLWERLKNEELYTNVSKMFFIDRDMDDIPNNIDDDLYITPCYSIENLYANEEAFLSIIETEFMINKCDSDFKKCENAFKKTFEAFCKEMLDFNGLVMLREKKKLGHNKIKFSDYKIHRMLNISLENVVRQKYYEEIKKNLLEEMGSNIKELEECKTSLEKKGNFVRDFRGKQQLDFVVHQIKELKKCNDDCKFFSKKRNNIHINITKNRLSELSSYAITPESLKKFVLNHKLKGKLDN